ncbi:endonuclease domain-containing 1 protein-like [Erpetoichthys calabaricus]|uniref:endonuclease domain-containing 1 protein-like n=1 Tax=Erpetoichthys calabaricus TaxID=27687 RepID=UPI002234D714|nr:endonuclease domain-containing 1 protein-like [Erpetoichthys calabaricus]
MSKTALSTLEPHESFTLCNHKHGDKVPDRTVTMMLLMLVIPWISTMWGNCEVMKGKKFTCTQFFHKGEEPSGLEPNRSARICQTHEGKVHFATMYDREKRIPIYSAYKYNRKDGKFNRSYYYEPQLVDLKNGKKMMKMPENATKEVKESQAVSEDYKKENMNIFSKQYNRGHLNPIIHHNDIHSKEATCTLTNIVPQLQDLNGGQWTKYEGIEMQNFTKGCKKTYVIVGVITGNNYTYTNNEKRVNVPSHIWTAACCVNEKGTSEKFFGYIAKNNKNEVKNISLVDLQYLLKTAFGSDVTLFNGDCKGNRNTLFQNF